MYIFSLAHAQVWLLIISLEGKKKGIISRIVKMSHIWCRFCSSDSPGGSEAKPVWQGKASAWPGLCIVHGLCFIRLWSVLLQLHGLLLFDAVQGPSSHEEVVQP